jgi:hypothetical protein
MVSLFATVSTGFLKAWVGQYIDKSVENKIINCGTFNPKFSFTRYLFLMTKIRSILGLKNVTILLKKKVCLAFRKIISKKTGKRSSSVAILRLKKLT